ncbi:hypothetical protein N9W89_11190 [Hellea sp.]|nr:hypothetical protein [Hellea sp.]
MCGDAAFDTLAELLAVASYAGAHIIFNFGSGNALTIVGHNIADLNAGNFSFTSIMAEPLGDHNAFSTDPLGPEALRL